MLPPHHYPVESHQLMESLTHHRQTQEAGERVQVIMGGQAGTEMKKRANTTLLCRSKDSGENSFRLLTTEIAVSLQPLTEFLVLFQPISVKCLPVFEISCSITMSQTRTCASVSFINEFTDVKKRHRVPDQEKGC